MSTHNSCSLATAVGAILSCTLVGLPTFAGTKSFSGTVLSVKKGDVKAGAKELAKVSARIDQVQYTSNQASWIDRPMDWSVHAKYSAVMLHGEFVSPQAFANALSARTWGYFYESTWLDLYLTPDYHYGEVSAHDEGKKVVTLDVWRTNKDYHYPESVEKQVAVTYGGDTVFRIEGEASTADQVLNHTGGTLQVHPPREQVILLETGASRFDPGQMVLDAKRGQANGRCRNAVFLRREPDKYVFRTAEGEEIVLNKQKQIGVLDGKLSVDNAIAFKPGRHVALGYYRWHKTPHYVFLRTMDDEVRGVVKKVAGSTMTVLATAWDGSESDITVKVDPAGAMYLDGVNGQELDAIKVGQGIRVFPKRPQTIVALKRRELITKKDKVISEGYFPVASFRCPQRIVGTQKLTFDARSSYALDGEIKSYAWDFGDGTTAEGKEAQHTFAADGYGQFEVQLTVTDARGYEHSTRRHVVVAPALMKEQRVEGLKPGLKLQAWNRIDDKHVQKKMEAEGPAVAMQGEPQDTKVIPSFDYVATNLGRRERAAWRTSGYLEAPRDGWYVIASISKSQLTIDDIPILQGATGSQSLGQRSFVYLAKGLHTVQFDFAGELTYNRFTWMHPDGERVASDNVSENITEDAMWRTYRPLGSLVFH